MGERIHVPAYPEGGGCWYGALKNKQNTTKWWELTRVTNNQPPDVTHVAFT